MNLSILFVDDEPDVLTSMGRILRRDGYRVDIAMTIAEVTDRDNWSDYFAVLLDRNLPDGMSDHLVPRIKQLAPQAAIIVITGYADLESSLASLRNGVEDYLLKPIEPDVVLHRLCRIREKQRADGRARQAERLAAIGEMMAAVAHESRNALQRIQAGVDMVRMDLEDNPDALQDLARIERAGDNLRTLFDELRNYAAPIQLDRSSCDLSGVWQRAWSQLAPAREGRETDLEENTNGLDLRFSIDAFRMEQVFRNLMENSLAACSDLVRITIACNEMTLAGARAICVSVRDSGPGLTAEQKTRVFEAFFTTKSKGSGLGMAIAQRCIEAHQGTITVGDGGHGGAEFLITLPRK